MKEQLIASGIYSTFQETGQRKKKTRGKNKLWKSSKLLCNNILKLLYKRGYAELRLRDKEKLDK